MKKRFEDLLNYCLYICEDEDSLLDLNILQLKLFSNTWTEEDYKELILIDKKLRLQYK